MLLARGDARGGLAGKILARKFLHRRCQSRLTVRPLGAAAPDDTTKVSTPKAPRWASREVNLNRRETSPRTPSGVNSSSCGHFCAWGVLDAEPDTSDAIDKLRFTVERELAKVS